ncbi:hypothetical protein Pan216_41320 [Planctomycetes bacterium Pan216]|uniref:Uncharacterized protein n=1 Tax=Kolteria novifilia TaxID=2527975 RepID=A0A518B8E7_9BACT|nr:hypothetical protein Pan216_41320 [Planctomycetes bacterium Pan216]
MSKTGVTRLRVPRRPVVLLGRPGDSFLLAIPIKPWCQSEIQWMPLKRFGRNGCRLHGRIRHSSQIARHPCAASSTGRISLGQSTVVNQYDVTQRNRFSRKHIVRQKETLGGFSGRERRELGLTFGGGGGDSSDLAFGQVVLVGYGGTTEEGRRIHLMAPESTLDTCLVGSIEVSDRNSRHRRSQRSLDDVVVVDQEDRDRPTDE